MKDVDSASQFGPQHLDSWERDGYVCVKGLLSAETASNLDRWITEASELRELEGRRMHHYEMTANGPQLARTEAFLERHAALRELLTTGVIASVLERLFGEPAVIYKEKINYKHPGGGGYAAHQDAPAYDFVDRHITCLVAADPATLKNGCLHFAAGQHKRGLIDLDASGCIASPTAESMEWKPCPVAPGDVVFFCSYTPHFSGPNDTSDSRRSLYVTYNAASAGDCRLRYYADRDQALASGSPSANRISKIGHFQGRVVPEESTAP